MLGIVVKTEDVDSYDLVFVYFDVVDRARDGTASSYNAKMTHFKLNVSIIHLNLENNYLFPKGYILKTSLMNMSK